MYNSISSMGISAMAVLRLWHSLSSTLAVVVVGRVLMNQDGSFKLEKGA